MEGGKTRRDWYLRLKRVQFKLANLQGNVLAKHKEQRQKRGGERRHRGRGERGKEKKHGNWLVDVVKTSKLPSQSRRALLTMTQIRILSLTSFAANRQKSSADL